MYGKNECQELPDKNNRENYLDILADGLYEMICILKSKKESMETINLKNQELIKMHEQNISEYEIYREFLKYNKEEPSSEELLNEKLFKEFLNEEPSSEELLNEEFLNEESLNEGFLNEEFLNEEFLNEEFLNVESSDEESSDEESLDEESSKKIKIEKKFLEFYHQKLENKNLIKEDFVIKNKKYILKKETDLLDEIKKEVESYKKEIPDDFKSKFESNSKYGYKYDDTFNNIIMKIEEYIVKGTHITERTEEMRNNLFSDLKKIKEEILNLILIYKKQLTTHLNLISYFKKYLKTESGEEKPTIKEFPILTSEELLPYNGYIDSSKNLKLFNEEKCEILFEKVEEKIEKEPKIHQPQVQQQMQQQIQPQQQMQQQMQEQEKKLEEQLKTQQQIIEEQAQKIKRLERENANGMLNTNDMFNNNTYKKKRKPKQNTNIFEQPQVKKRRLNSYIPNNNSYIPNGFYNSNILNNNSYIPNGFYNSNIPNSNSNILNNNNYILNNNYTILTNNKTQQTNWEEKEKKRKREKEPKKGV